MQYKSILAFVALASAVPLLKQREEGVETVTTWEMVTITSYTTVYGAAVPASTPAPPVNGMPAQEPNAQGPKPVTAVQQGWQHTRRPQPAQSTTTTEAAPIPSTTTTAIAVTPPSVVVPTTSSTTTQAAAQPTTPASGGSSYAVSTLPGASKPNGPCTPDQPCTGDITHYNPSQGVGACGPKDWISGKIWTDDDLVVAVPWQMMGTQSNGGTADSVNPLCKRSVLIKGQGSGTDQIARVVDKCGGCLNTGNNNDLDLSPALFNLVAPQGDGRVHNVEWHWV